ncbi:MAG: enoyl-CoA hydratase/isomerase family protein [Polyangiaceae bacterium]|nr:enoyl-CoA hydratase/isomerase family protein [Polyangiaceae bacterium]
MTVPLLVCDRPAPGVARIRFNRPEKRNALSTELRDRTTDALHALGEDDAVKIVVLAGAGGSFSAGFDLEEFGIAATDEAFHARLWASSDRYHQALLRFPLPLLAAVDGAALGGGFDTAVLCDVRVASDRASFGHPEIAFGDVVYAPLRELIGGGPARELCLSGRRIDAAEARAIGLISSIHPPAELDDAAVALAGRIARSPREVLQRTKAKFVDRADIAFRRTLEL